MKLRRNDAEDFQLDETTVLRHYPPDDASFSISILDVDGTHKREPERETAYYVLGGSGHLHLEEHI
ncbi:MAG: hypothetical protein SVU32_06745, partial [Candidatus Nanohaloarchaea archaeon]|nr:hypothetical protein [Candidatus Nanohaloarchaea archaeon]